MRARRACRWGREEIQDLHRAVTSRAAGAERGGSRTMTFTPRSVLDRTYWIDAHPECERATWLMLIRVRIGHDPGLDRHAQLMRGRGPGALIRRLERDLHV